MLGCREMSPLSTPENPMSRPPVSLRRRRPTCAYCSARSCSRSPPAAPMDHRCLRRPMPAALQPRPAERRPTRATHLPRTPTTTPRRKTRRAKRRCRQRATMSKPRARPSGRIPRRHAVGLRRTAASAAGSVRSRRRLGDGLRPDPPPWPRLVAHDKADRQRRRKTWKQNVDRYALPAGSKVLVQVAGSTPLRTMLGESETPRAAVAGGVA